jgi:hypothetical protein
LGIATWLQWACVLRPWPLSHKIAAICVDESGAAHPPASEVSLRISFAGKAARMAVATSRGAFGAPSLPFILPCRPIALLHW